MRIGGRRSSFAILGLLSIFGIGIIGLIATELPPVRMMWRYGISCGPEPTRRTLTLEGVEFVEISPGCYRMGSNKIWEGGDLLGRWCARLGLPWGDQPVASDEIPVHWVEFPRGFFIARHEVTNEQYQAFNSHHERSDISPGDDSPVVNVSWEDAKQYCAWLSEKSGQAIRLPSESEWECACRAGSEREFCFGDDAERLSEYAWYDANSDAKIHAVGTRRANAWGLHDLHGNVWEWCEDRYHDSYEDAPTDGTARMEGDRSFYHVQRGGSSDSTNLACRSAYRLDVHPRGWAWDTGFRPAFLPPPKNE